jgi:hypothetical protein
MKACVVRHRQRDGGFTESIFLVENTFNHVCDEHTELFGACLGDKFRLNAKNK